MFKKKIVKDKTLKIKVSNETLNEIEKIKEELKTIDDSLQFDIEELLYDHLILSITKAQKEIFKTKNSIKKQNTNENENSLLTENNLVD